MALTEAQLPAYFTAAWDEFGKLTIQQLQKRDVVYRDGVVISSQLLPIELIMAPHTNDTVTPGLLTEALNAVAAGQLLAVAQLTADHAAAVEEYEAKLTAKAADAEALKVITDQAAADADATKKDLTEKLTAAEAKIPAPVFVLDPAEPVPVVAPMADVVPAPEVTPVIPQEPSPT